MSLSLCVVLGLAFSWIFRGMFFFLLTYFWIREKHASKKYVYSLNIPNSGRWMMFQFFLPPTHDRLDCVYRILYSFPKHTSLLCVLRLRWKSTQFIDLYCVYYKYADKRVLRTHSESIYSRECSQWCEK